MNIVALVACAVVVVIKTPGALRGQGRVSYAAFVMLGLALLLTIPVVYLTVDGWMGSRNFANVLVRVAVFGVASAMAVTLARVFRVYWIESFVLSWRGMTAVAVSTVAEVVLLAVTTTGPSTPGLPISVWDPNSARLSWMYFAVGVLYPAILAGLLLVPTVRFIVRSHGAFVRRLAYSFMALGMAGLVVMAAGYSLSAITLVHLDATFFSIGWLSAISFCGGVVLHAAWGYVSRLREQDQEVAETTAA